MLNRCTNVREEIRNQINIIQRNVMKKMMTHVGEVILVKYNIDEVWADYLFILQGFLYRWDICFAKHNQILELLKIMYPTHDPSERIFIGALPQCDELSYEFENLLVSFAKLYEEPLLIEISRHISRSEQKTLRDCSPKRDDENGLFWEMNLLRNRSAHSTPGFYTIHNDYAARYTSISSKIHIIEYIDDRYIFDTYLLSLRKNEYIKNVIRKSIIQGKAEVPLLDLLFKSTVPKGKGKKNPQVLDMNNVKFFDLNEEFLELSLDMFNLIKMQLGIFERSI